MSSRIIIKKGKLNLITRNTAKGIVCQMINEKNEILKGNKTYRWYNGIKYTCGEKESFIALPYKALVDPSNKCILVHDSYADITEIKKKSENFKLKGCFNILNESIIPGQMLKVSFKPLLFSNGRETSLEQIKKGIITVNMEKSLSHWISPKSVAPIEPGDSATVVFKFTPDESMELNKAKAGYFVLNCQEKGTGVTIYFNITPVTETNGKLTLDVVDNYTFYGIDEDTQLANTLANTNSLDNAPHVDDAKVTVSKPGTNELVAEGTTSGNGLFMVELPGGFYKFTVEAEGHKKTTFEKEIPSGLESRHEVMLFCDDYFEASWGVEETEIEDEYKGTTSYTFETRVPVPRLIVTFPKWKRLCLS